MNNLLIYRWTCPHCAFSNTRHVRPESPYYPDAEVSCCDEEEGGCGKMVVVVPTVKVTVIAYKVADEGVES